MLCKESIIGQVLVMTCMNKDHHSYLDQRLGVGNHNLESSSDAGVPGPFISDIQPESGQPLCCRGVSLRIPIGDENHVKLQPIETKDYYALNIEGFETSFSYPRELTL